MAKKEKKVIAVEKAVRDSETNKIRKLDETTIEKSIVELKEQLFNLRFQSAVGKLENTAQISKTRKQIARMKTVLTERAKGLR
jgi:large subunit ribosomal protein L29